MKRMAAVIMIALLLLPGVALAGSSTDAALGLGAFAVFNQILGGVGIFGGHREPVYAAPPVVMAPPPVVVAPEPVVVVRQPVVVYQTPPPVYYYRTYVRYAPSYPAWVPPGHAKRGHWQEHGRRHR